VFNLEGGAAGLQGAMEYLDRLKMSMHELMNIPESALGQSQPVSNTSGVALAIQFQPLMNRWTQKTAQYGIGIEKINELIMLNLAIKEPETFKYNPEVNGPIKEGQFTELDPNDPITYQTAVYFPQPLPLDKLLILNELQQKMQMGLESKEGALRALGEEFPEEKLQEIRAELVADATSDGALKLIQTQITKEIMDITGMMPGPDGQAMPMDPMMLGDGDVMGDGIVGPANDQSAADPNLNSTMMADQAEAGLREKLVNEAYGTVIPQRRTVEKDN
jgi:hypothetical protein